MLYWSIEPIVLDLKYTWKISRNASDQKTNLIVSVTDGIHTGKGEAAPNVRYNESAEEGIILFDHFDKSVPSEIANASSLESLLRSLRLFNSLSFAIESAWFAFEAARTGKSFFELTDVAPPGKIFTSYTIPIMDTGKLKSFFLENKLERFRFVKLKVDYENAFDSIKYLSTFCRQPIMVDANESFRDVDQCIKWLEKIRKIPLAFVEQPMPASLKEESEYLKKYSPFPLFADESMTDTAAFSELKKSFDGVNMKLMKAGGFLNGIRLLKDARSAGLQTMIGCMVETTLGISAAMRLCSLVDYADLDSFILVKDEPFGLVNEVDGGLHFS